MKEQNFKETEIGKIPVDWEVDNLNNLSVKIASGKSNTTNFYGGKYPIYGSTGLIGNKEYYDYEGDKLTVARVGANAGLLNKISGKYCISDNTLFIETNDLINNDFLFEFLDSINLNKYIFGSGQPLITGGILKMLEIPLPPLAEQEKIAEVLSDTDLWIESTEALLAKKRQIKKGVMQKLLSPKEDWEVRKLGEIGECIRGVSYNGVEDLSDYETENTIRLLRSNNIKYSKVNFHDIQNVNIARVKTNQIMLDNDILICMANGSKQLVGKAGIFKKNNKEFCFGAFMAVFRCFENINSTFIFYNFLTKNYRNHIDLLLAGSSINNLKGSDIASITIGYPSLKTQQEIAEILSSMDLEIESLENRLQKARNIKQGMMQDLLTGKVRLGY